MKQPLIKKVLTYFMLVLATGYIGCVIFFTHVHIIDGVVIAHAHKTADSNGEQHQHTSNELILFHTLFHYAISDINVPQYTFKEWPCYLLDWNVNIYFTFPSHYYYHCQFRAPPLILS
ncbi:MAG: hypothetical protein IJ338_05020 [Bacteroidaceae bacterium]|nr:hypothetical protein [Bacteroidaceae bacterium]